MEVLFGGNSLVLLFGVYITFMIGINERFKIIVLMYLLTYMTNIMNIVPTIRSYMFLLVALFIQIEFFEDQFKKKIITNWLEKALDFIYILVAEYAFIPFTISLFLSSGHIIEMVSGYMKYFLYIASALIFFYSCNEAASQKYVVCSFGEMKKKIDECMQYRLFLELDSVIGTPYSVLCVEDVNFFDRGERYSFLNAYYLKKRYWGKLFAFVKSFLFKKQRIAKVKRVLRGYSTIEMQLLRTIAIKEGYDYIIRRKVFEILYARLFWKNLRQYYEKCGCSIVNYKDYLLILYLRLATCLNKGGAKLVGEVMGSRKEILEYTPEKLFVLSLCFSGKIKWSNVLEIYHETICNLGLNRNEVARLVRALNQ